VTFLGCVVTGGLLYVVYVIRVLRCAQQSTTTPVRARTILLFGKRLENGQMDSDFQARIARVQQLLEQGGVDCIVFLGGCHEGNKSEAALASDALRMQGVAVGVELLMDETSRNTLENLHNARALLGVRAANPVALLSSRYHLARCAAIAQAMGFNFELCAAEQRLSLRLGQVLLEAAFLCWIDVARRWAYWVGYRRMMARIS